MEEQTRKPLSEARKRANAKYIKAHYQRITFMVKKGARERIVQAATAKGESVNGFIRGTLNKAVADTIGQPMEDAVDGEE